MPTASAHQSRAHVTDLIGDRSLSARSVLATALLGADEPHLTVGELVGIASLFGISDGAARTCLWRMVSAGELTGDDGIYALAGSLLERRQRVDEAARFDDTALPWDGTWELAVVSLDRRSAADRLALRKAATGLHLGELREGVWIRPDNLNPNRLPTLRAVLDRQCVHFHGAATDAPPETVRSLFNLDGWASDARRLTVAMHDERDVDAVDADDFIYLFALSITVVRHLQLDPLLPPDLEPEDWPGHELRSTYRQFDVVFKRQLARRR
ncbi:PaaX family transcriptional regulator C-terminal domain-containing protein [Mycolicibacterium tusciae]|uniref:PaaX family transcriptional regulator C-terminal domain-containing protein n=1 Tax=Mycolicibacterium tusciae TaxID=75922 RepID=UPI00024A12C5|nr:PaaX family transcriptional regulator C-terminal domain-containing protein [Mycolicibacterium tusciae]